MRLLVLFGSSSDESTYSPLCTQLSSKHQVNFEVLSAHRDPVALDERLKRNDFDAIVAGAGLAAHLPGVVASKTEKPVLGIPVDSAFGGLDALASIVQMPFGVPVLTVAPHQSSRVVSFLNEVDEKKSLFGKNPLVVADPHLMETEIAQKEIQRTQVFCKERGIEFQTSSVIGNDHFCIHLVTIKSVVVANMFGIHVPLLDDEKKSQPDSFLELYHLLQEGGLWVGVNNLRNGLISYLKLKRIFYSN